MTNREFIYENYATIPTKEIAERLGMTVGSVRTIACGMGLKKTGDNKDLPDEEWIIHPNFPDYFISNKGRIKSKYKGRILSTREHEGYLDCRIHDVDGNKKSPRIHRLVAEVFVENIDPENLTVVNHIDGNKLNNDSRNLEWTNYSINNEHARLTGLAGYRTGTLSIEKVLEICYLLQEGLSYSEITSRDPEFTRGIVEKIRQRKRWTSVSKYYKWQ